MTFARRRSLVPAHINRPFHRPTCAGRSGKLQIAQFIADTFCSWLVLWSQHLFHVTIGRENKNHLSALAAQASCAGGRGIEVGNKLNLRSEIFGTFADNITQARCNHFAELNFVKLSRFGFPKTLCLGRRFCKCAVMLRAIRRKFRVLRAQTGQRQERNCCNAKKQGTEIPFHRN